MNGTDRASHYPYHQYHQHQYHHHQYHQRPHPHHSLPSLAAAAAAAGSFPFAFDLDSLPTTGGLAVDPTAGAGTGSSVFATPPLSTTGTTAECCYHFDEGMRRYASNGVVPPSAPASAAIAAAYLSFPSHSTRRPNIDARFASAPISEMTSQTASPADCSGGLSTDVKGTRPTPAGDTKENVGLQSNYATTSTGNIVNLATSSVTTACSDDVYSLLSDDVSRHHKRLSTDDNTDDVIKNVNETDTAASSPSRDHSQRSEKKKTVEGEALKHDVSKVHGTIRLF